MSDEMIKGKPMEPKSGLRTKKLTLSFGQSQLREIEKNFPKPKVNSVETPKPEIKLVENKPQTKAVGPKATETAGEGKKIDKQPKRDHREIHAKVKEKFLTKMVRELGVDEVGQLPLFFTQERVMPAKVGLYNDLIRRFPDFKDRKVLRSVVRPFFYEFAYLCAVIEEKQRFDLDMNPVEGEKGEISEAIKQDAQKMFEEKIKAIKKAQQKRLERQQSEQSQSCL